MRYYTATHDSEKDAQRSVEDSENLYEVQVVGHNDILIHHLIDSKCVFAYTVKYNTRFPRRKEQRASVVHCPSV